MAKFNFSEFVKNINYNKKNSWYNTRTILLKLDELCHGSYVPFVFVHAFANNNANWQFSSKISQSIVEGMALSIDAITSFLKNNPNVQNLIPDITNNLSLSKKGSYCWAFTNYYDQYILSVLKEYKDPFFNDGSLKSVDRTSYIILLDILKYSLPIEPDYDETPKSEENYFSDKEEWLDFFDNFILRINGFQADNSVDTSFVRIVNGLFEDAENALLYDPYNNMGAFALNVNAQMSTPREQKIPAGYLATEYNQDNVRSTSVRLLLRDCISTIVMPDHVKNDNEKKSGVAVNRSSKKIYYAVMPPFTNKDIVNGEIIDPIVNSVEMGLSFSNIGGKMVCIVPSSVLVQKHYQKLREEMLSTKHAIKIILMPRGAMKSTDASISIIFIDGTKECDKVKFIDATNYVKKTHKEINVDYIAISNLCYHDSHPANELFHYGPEVWTPNEQCFHDEWNDQFVENLSKESFSHDIKMTLKEEIRQNNFDLNPSLYFNQPILAPEGFEVKNLAGILSSVTEVVSAQGIKKFISAKDIHANESLLEIDDKSLSKVDLSTIGRNYVYKIGIEPTILISKVGSLSPCALRAKEPIYGNVNNVNAYVIKDNSINAMYLASEMRKPYFTNQLHLSKMMSTINELVLSKLNIFVPLATKGKTSFSLQQNIVEKEMLEKMGILGEQLKRSNDDRFNEYEKELHQRKHRVSQYLGNVGPALDNLINAFAKHDGILKISDVVSKKSGLTVGQYLDMMRESIDKMSNLIGHLVDRKEWGVPEKIDVEKFIREFTEKHIHTNYKFQVIIDEVSFLGEENDSVVNGRFVVRMPKDELMIVFENIVANAETWGFTDPSREDYVIKFSLGIIDGDKVRVSISNNGTPIDPKTDLQNLFEWGVGNHTGIGTNDARKIIRHYDGTIDIYTHPKSEDGFETEYEIIIPMEI